MKIQTMTLPGGGFIFILSEVENLEDLDMAEWVNIHDRVGSRHTLAFEEPVEVIQ